jgi:predicted Zn-dependent protease
MKRLVFPLALSLAAIGCGGSAKLTESQEYFMGRGVAALAIEKDNLWSDQKLEEYVMLVGMTVALESDRPETYRGYTFAILNTDVVNAFAGPSGFIFVTKGALRSMQSEDELAGVLAHEVAHVNLRHPELAAQRASDAAGLTKFAEKLAGGLGFLGDIAGAMGKKQYAEYLQTAKDAAPAFGKALNAGYEQMSNGYSRDEEFAADALAVRFLCRAGVMYDPNAFKAFIARLPKKGGAYGTHPEHEGRVKAIEDEIQKQGAKTAPLDAGRTNRFLAMKAGLGQ